MGEYYIFVKAGKGDAEDLGQDYSFIVMKDNITSNLETSTVDVSSGTAVKSVTISKLEIYSELEEGEVARVGDRFSLYGVVEPDNMNEDLELTWASSDKTIATVSKKGVVTCKGVGKVTISATTTDGSNITASTDIEISRALSDVNTLSRITYTQGRLTPKFSKSKKSYTLLLGKEISKVSVRVIATDSKSKIMVNGKKKSVCKIKLKVGKSKILKILVISESGKERVYIIKVRRN